MKYAKLLLGTLSVLLVGLAGVVLAGDGNLEGRWTLAMEVNLPAGDAQSGEEGAGEEGADCLYEGSADVGLDGTSVFGTANYTLLQGVESCPAEMEGTLSGEFDGGSIQMGGVMGELGAVDFDGFISIPAAAGFLGINGDFLVTAGAFAGASGTYIGSTGSINPLDVPAVGLAGVLALTLLLLGAGYLTLRRSRSTTST